MEKKFGVGLASNLEWIEALIHWRLEEIANDCLRSGSNQELKGMNLVGLVDHPIDLGPYDLLIPPDTDHEMPPPSAGEDTEEKESVGANELVDGRRGTC